jgi:hypothetical protein
MDKGEKARLISIENKKLVCNFINNNTALWGQGDDMSPIKKMINERNALEQMKRTSSQMVLGELIDHLNTLPMDTIIKGLGPLMSYRGYYCDLSFELIESYEQSAAQLLDECNSALGKTFIGYKGGDFVMDESTPLWVSFYGATGFRLVSFNSDGTYIMEPEED